MSIQMGFHQVVDIEVSEREELINGIVHHRQITIRYLDLNGKECKQIIDLYAPKEEDLRMKGVEE